MKVFATSNSNNGLFRTAAAYTLLLMAVAISKATNVVAKSNCASLHSHKHKCRREPGCHWVLNRFAKSNPEPCDRAIRCVHVMTNMQCSVYNDNDNPKATCRVHGCKWNKDEHKCIGRAENSLNNNRNDNLIEPTDDTLKRGVDVEFLEDLIGMDGTEATIEIQDEYPEYLEEDGVFVIAVCSSLHGFHVNGGECVTRDLNTNRIKLIVDGDNIVVEIVIG